MSLRSFSRFACLSFRRSACLVSPPVYHLWNSASASYCHCVFAILCVSPSLPLSLSLSLSLLSLSLSLSLSLPLSLCLSVSLSLYLSLSLSVCLFRSLPLSRSVFLRFLFQPGLCRHRRIDACRIQEFCVANSRNYESGLPS